MKEKKYTLPEEQNPAFTSEPEPNYHGNAAIALPEEDVRTQTASNTLRDICQTIVWWSPKD